MIDPLAQAFRDSRPSQRTKELREGRGTGWGGNASEIKSLSRPPRFSKRTRRLRGRHTPTRLGQLHLETQADEIRSNNEKHQAAVAHYHAEVFAESADHCPD